VLRVPNFYLGLMRVATWLLWRKPVASKSKPTPPRRPTLGFTTGATPDEIHSIVRLSWFQAGRAVEVDEFQIAECEDADQIFHYTVGQALRNGADVCVLTAYTPDQLGVPTDC
jgi:hypothetical protein